MAEMIQARAAVLREVGRPMTIETIGVGPVGAGDVLVKVKAASLCHTDLEVIEGQLAQPLPAVLGHEVAGVVNQVGAGVRGLAVGDPVVLHWNPHCGLCFHCERGQPILCDTYLANGAKGSHFDGAGPRFRCDDGKPLPVGSTVRVRGHHDAPALLGFDGVVYLDTLDVRNVLDVDTPADTCHVTFDYHKQGDGIPQIGPLTCREEQP